MKCYKCATLLVNQVIFYNLCRLTPFPKLRHQSCTTCTCTAAWAWRRLKMTSPITVQKRKIAYWVNSEQYTLPQVALSGDRLAVEC